MGTMEPEDSILWARSRAGDTAAFGVLFERHAREIYNYLFRRTGDWALAEDLLSVVFLEAWRRRRKKLDEGKVRPWLFGIATNVLRTQRRSRRRYKAALRRIPRPEPDSGFADLSDERLDDERRVDEALARLSALSRNELDVFVLCAWMGLGYEDAAAALGIRVGTVKSRISRAREKLGEPEPPSGHEEEETA
jgi:RNA polymerase sigma-70 factor (ECF subfamily)